MAQPVPTPGRGIYWQRFEKGCEDALATKMRYVVDVDDVAFFAFTNWRASRAYYRATVVRGDHSGGWRDRSPMGRR